MRMRRAFTIIEILVTISIIALILSILLPALSQARESAKRVVCVSNQRQLLLSYTVYSEDYEGVFPSFSITSPSATDDRLIYNQVSTFNANWQVIVPQGYLVNYEIFFCPSHPWYDLREDLWAIQHVSYMYLGGPNYFLKAVAPLDYPDKDWFDSAFTNSMPSNAPLVADMMSQATQPYEGLYGNNHAPNYPLGGNVSYVDGHVRWKAWEDAYDFFYYRF